MRQNGTSQFADDLDGASIVIGSRRFLDGPFRRRLYASKWQGAFSFDLEEVDAEPDAKLPALVDVNGKQAVEFVSWHKRKSRLHHLDGAEWSVTYEQLPEDPICFALRPSLGVEVFHQPPLPLGVTDIQPEEAVDSFAIYAPRSGRIVRRGEVLADWGTGKLAHLMCPAWIAGDGAKGGRSAGQGED